MKKNQIVTDPYDLGKTEDIEKIRNSCIPARKTVDRLSKLEVEIKRLRELIERLERRINGCL